MKYLTFFLKFNMFSSVIIGQFVFVIMQIFFHLCLLSKLQLNRDS